MPRRYNCTLSPQHTRQGQYRQHPHLWWRIRKECHPKATHGLLGCSDQLRRTSCALPLVDEEECLRKSQPCRDRQLLDL